MLLHMYFFELTSVAFFVNKVLVKLFLMKVVVDRRQFFRSI